MSGRWYTQEGDAGYTGLLGAGRVAKEDPRIEALGAVDETMAALGLARAHALSAGADALVVQIQRDLYGLMAELASTPENVERFRRIDAGRVSWLEEKTDVLGTEIDVPGEFIIPGDSAGGAYFDMARAVARRAERRVSELLHRQALSNPDLLRYLNRLSSLCFILELRENQAAGNASVTLAKTG